LHTAEHKHGNDGEEDRDDLASPRALKFEQEKILQQSPEAKLPSDQIPESQGARSSSVMSGSAAAQIDWEVLDSHFVQFGNELLGDSASAFYVRGGTKEVGKKFKEETGFKGCVMLVVNTGEHFVVESDLESGFWYHDGCGNDGDSCTRAEPSDSPTYFLLAVKDEFLREDWESNLGHIQVTNKWAKLQFACRFKPGKEQVLRSCSVDAITVVMVVLRELSRPEAKLFEVAGFFPGVTRRGSSGLSVKMQTMGLRNEFARLVVGALKVFSTSTESHWISIVGAWSHIADGFPEYVDWDAAEVLIVLQSCKHLTQSEVQQCINASYPDDQELTLGQDMLDAQDAIQKEAAVKNSLRSSRANAEEVRAQVAIALIAALTQLLTEICSDFLLLLSHCHW
jgi:hypothetical protein